MCGLELNTTSSNSPPPPPFLGGPARPSVSCIAGAVGLALLSKEQGITVLAVCIVYEMFGVSGYDLKRVSKLVTATRLV